jgi:hypothetical protein
MAVQPFGGYCTSSITLVGATWPLWLPAGWQPGDLAIIRVTCPTNFSFVNFFGWTKIQDQVITGARRVGVFKKVLVAGDGNGTMTFSNVCAFTMEGVGLRTWDPSYTLVPSTTGSSSSATSIPAPSVATGYGALLCFHTKQQTDNAGSGFNSWTPAPGMTILGQGHASSQSGGSINAGPQTMVEWEPRTTGTSGTRTAISLYNNTALYPGPWAATSIFVRGLVDQVMALGKVSETNTVRTLTAAFGPTTMNLGKVFETNVVRSIINPLEGVWTSPPMPLKDIPVTGSYVVWDADIPVGASLLIETSTDNGASWQVAEDAEPIARLVIGSLVAKTVLARATLRRSTLGGATPVLRRLEFAVSLDASQDEYIPLGVFTLNDTEISDSPEGLVLELSGTDLSRKVARNRWEQTYVVYPGSNYGDVIMRIIRNRLPGTQFNFASTDKVTPLLFFGEQSSNDAWQDAQDLALAIGHELYFDPYGVCTLRPEPDPAIDSPVWELEDLVNPTILSLTRRVTDENTYNRIVVIGEGSGLEEPVRGVATDEDPASPTYILGPYGTVTQIIRSSMVLTNVQAYDAARAALLRNKGMTEAIEMDIIPMAALEPGDILVVNRSRSKVEGQFIIDSMQIPLGAEGSMHIVSRRQRLG